MRILYHGEAGPRQRARFADAEAAHDLRIELCAPDDVDRLTALLVEIDAWWHVLTPITVAHLDAAPNLRLIHKWGVGVNTIDVDGAAKRGIAVANMPGSNAAACAEAAMMGILGALRHLPTYHMATLAGRGWQVPAEVGESCGEVAGRTVGLVGFGDIAQRLASVVTVMGATVYHHSIRRDRPGWLPLDDLLAISDVVSLHVPLNAETERLMNAARLASMRPGAILVNTARGGLVDLDALAGALASGALGGAALDVFAEEPNDARHPLFALPNVVATPHVAWLTWETLERSLDLAIDNAVRLREGRELMHRVN